jgi:hypothetical protein
MLHPAEQDVGGTFHSEGNYQDLHSLVDLPCIEALIAMAQSLQWIRAPIKRLGSGIWRIP